MKIAQKILEEFPKISKAQKDVISHDEGPLLVIAGPGSGKTFCLVLRAVNLFLLEKAKPAELILCTFTEKVAFELRDRITDVARKVGYKKDMSELRVGTIHGICNHIISQHRHQTSLGSGYETLDELTQALFIFDHFNEICGKDSAPPYFEKWKTKWGTIDGLREYFNKITEELVDKDDLKSDDDPFLHKLGKAYDNYQEMLFKTNHVDFAHLQKIVHNLLRDKKFQRKIASNIRYILVDEYQDTNYVQEQLLLQLALPNNNICVVGDEDQSIYRFRGATVRNILEFPDRLPSCKKVLLTTNYRSHKDIVTAYDRWMSSANWSSEGIRFRYSKKIEPDLDAKHPDYPAIFAIWGQNAKDEAARFADFVEFIKKKKIISDYSQVALLLHSVKSERSGSFLEALQDKGIPAFCPRARAFFENEEIKLMMGCFAILFGYYGDSRGEVTGHALQELARYIDACLIDLGHITKSLPLLAKTIRELKSEIDDLTQGQTLDIRPVDLFYRFLAVDPFANMTKNENRARNLANFSQLLTAFQQYYHYPVISYRNREILRLHLFNSFFRLLHEGGINEYEDPTQPLPKGYVQVMTIHQAKGLEFPVTVVGSLDARLSSQKMVDRDLQHHYHRPLFEPENLITHFDRMRLHYVAFSRAAKILVLTTDEAPKDYFNPIWQGLPQWPYVQKNLLSAQKFEIKERMPVKRRYSFTSDLKVYETCPRQYEFYREYNFAPSRSAVFFFGQLVHHTIEEIHRIVIDGDFKKIDKTKISELFNRNYQFLLLTDVRHIAPATKEAAFKQVMNYFNQNKEEMKRVIETEVDVSLEKDNYILNGKIDLLLGGDGKLEILDFKTSEKPINSPELLAAYELQLCTYAHILEHRYGKRPERLLLYWTSEKLKKDALMEYPYSPNLVHKAGKNFDELVTKIQNRDFSIKKPPEPKICNECDLRFFCSLEGTLNERPAKK